MPQLTIRDASSIRPLRRRSVTNARLLDAAERLLIRRGFAATSIEGVCAEAGYTRGAFYSNFTNKEELLVSLLERHARRRFEALAQGFCSLPTSADALALAKALFIVSGEDRSLFLLFSEFRLHAARNSFFAAKVARYDRELTEKLAAVIAGYHWDVPVSPVEIARTLLAAREGIVARTLVGGQTARAHVEAAASVFAAILPVRWGEVMPDAGASSTEATNHPSRASKASQLGDDANTLDTRESMTGGVILA